MTEAEQIGSEIKKARIRQRLTQAQLGELCDPQMHQQHVATYEVGKLKAGEKVRERFAKALGKQWKVKYSYKLK